MVVNPYGQYFVRAVYESYVVRGQHLSVKFNYYLAIRGNTLNNSFEFFIHCCIVSILYGMILNVVQFRNHSDYLDISIL